jgi:putative ABC transport system substrate-binding protein
VLHQQSWSPSVVAFRDGLAEKGYVEGHSVAIEYRWGLGQYERLPEMAVDLVRHRVAVIAATGGVPSVRAAKAATSEIPIVFTMGGDPVAFGLVASLNRPGSNVTGTRLFPVRSCQSGLLCCAIYFQAPRCSVFL